MNISQGTMMAAMFVAAALIGASNPASAEVLNVPASAALMNGEYLASDCVVEDVPFGIRAGDNGGICDFQIPLEIPVGRTIQQIEVVNSSGPLAVLPEIHAHLSTLDFSTGATAMRFPWTANLMPGGALVATRIMQQTKFGYPDAFVVQPSTMYEIVLHLEAGALASGLRITYQ